MFGVHEVSRYLFLVSFLLLAVANFTSLRLKSAPPSGSGPFCWPWQLRDRYTRNGFVMNLAGLILWLASTAIGSVEWFL